MAVYSQQIRGEPYNGNPSGLSTDLLQIGSSFAEDGVPDETKAPGAILGNVYIDRLSGIEYKLTNSGWEPFVDFATIGPAGGGVPDPLNIGTVNASQLNGDLIQGGQIEMLSATNQVKLYDNAGDATLEAVGAQLHLAGFGPGPGQPGLVLDTPLYVNNKTITGVSLMRGDMDADIDLFSLGTGDIVIDSGSTASHNGNTSLRSGSTTEVYGGQALNLEGGFSCTLKGNSGLDVSSLGNLDIHSDQNDINIFSTIGKIDLQSNQDISMSTGPAGLSLTDSATSYGISFSGTAGIATNSGNDFAISHILANKNISLNTAGTGNIILNPGNDVSLNNKPLTDVSSFNGSENESRPKSLSVIGGALLFREPPRNMDWQIQNVGSNSTFFGESGVTTSPADFIAYNLGPASHTLVQVSVRINFNTAWTWGGGTSTLTIGTVLNTLPSIAANYVPLYTMNLNTAGNFYAQDSGDLNVIIPANTSMVCRLVNAGTVSTSNNAEMSVTAVMY